MEVLNQVISIVSGACGIGAGIVAIRARAKKMAPRPELPPPRAEVTSYVDESAVMEPRQPALLKPALYGGALACLLPVPFAAVAQDSVGMLWLLMAGLYLYAARAAGRSRSKTWKAASIRLRLPKDEAMQQSRSALEGLGLRVVYFDLNAGLIEARRGFNLRSTVGERVTVTVDEAGFGEAAISIESDAAWTSIGVDMGANRRNVDRFVRELTGGGSV